MKGTGNRATRANKMIEALEERVLLSLANLVPYTPSGWSAPVVVSTTSGGTTDSSSLTTASNLYVDWAVQNNGAAAAGAFSTALYVDSTFKTSWSTSSLAVGSYTYTTSAQCYNLGTLSAGTHTIEILADYTNAIAESNEADNAYTKTITINSAQSPPSVTTSSATSITSSSATLNGSFNTNGASTMAYFQYGTTTSYGSSTAQAGPFTNGQALIYSLTGLSPNITYHYRLVGTNSGGTSYGGDESFTTSNAQSAPTVTTSPATSVTANSATLNGTINPNGASTNAYFEWGTTTSYGSITSPPVVTSSSENISYSLAGLNPNTVYHYRIDATNSGGTNYGVDQSFTTINLLSGPVVTTSPATSVTSDSATLNGSFSPNGASTSVDFQYGTTTNYSYSTPVAGPFATGQTITYSLTGLAPNTTYHYRFVGSNSSGTNYGSDASFATPSVQSGPTISVTSPTPTSTWNVGTSYTINWSVSGNINSIYGYLVLLSTDNGNSYPTIIGGTVGAASTSIGYAPGVNQVTTAGVIWVKAIDSNADLIASGFPNGTFTITGGEPSTLAAPTSPTATNNLNNEVNISWAAITGAASYRVFRNTANSLSSAQLISPAISTPGYADSSAITGITYYYWICGVDSIGDQGYFAGPIIGSRAAALAAPTGVTATPESGGTTPIVDLSWQSVPNASNYRIFRDNTFISTTPDNNTEFVNTGGLIAGNSYNYQVQAINGTNTSQLSTGIGIFLPTSLIQTPPAPQTPPSVTSLPSEPDLWLPQTALQKELESDANIGQYVTAQSTPIYSANTFISNPTISAGWKSFFSEASGATSAVGTVTGLVTEDDPTELLLDGALSIIQETPAYQNNVYAKWIGTNEDLVIDSTSLAINLGTAFATGGVDVEADADAVLSAITLASGDILSPIFGNLANDPPDPNYAQVFVPQNISTTLSPPPGVPSDLANLMVQTSSDLDQTLTDMNAVQVTGNRYSTALANDDSASASMQYLAFLQYVGQYNLDARIAGSDLENLSSLLVANEIGTTAPTPLDAAASQSLLGTQGASMPGLSSFLESMGFTDPEINTMVQQALAISPGLSNEPTSQSLEDLGSLFENGSIQISLQSPSINSADNASFTVGKVANFLLTTTGTPDASFTIPSGLPKGLTFTNNGDGTATIAGTPAAGTAGVYTLTFDAGNGVGQDAIQTLTLTVNDAVVNMNILGSFGSGNTPHPNAPIFMDAAGDIWGTVYWPTAYLNYGGVFELPRGGNNIINEGGFDNNVYSQSGLIEDPKGHFYGTTYNGGSFGDGGVFEILNGNLTTAYSFDDTDGRAPAGDLVLDSKGDIFGTTTTGGANEDGTVFEIQANVIGINIIATFNGTDGSSPGGLISDGAGNLYGTTSTGGANNDGTVFEIPAETNTIVTLASFDDADGGAPGYGANLTIDAAGNLYGTTALGGLNEDGTVFEIPAGSNSIDIIATFNGTNGSNPGYSGLIADAAGNLFGTTEGGGANNDGTVFEIPFGTNNIVTLISFNGSDGAYPEAGLIADSAGNLYGTTNEGGANSDGAIFEVAGTGFFAAPEAALRTPEASIINGQTSALNFGALQQGSSASISFSIQNIGAAPLTITSLIAPAGYSVSQNSFSPLAPGASESFTVQLNTNNPGTFGGSISFRTNDPDNAEFNFPVSGIVTTPSAVIYVDASAPGPIHDGSSWTDAFTDLPSALGIVSSGQAIDVAQGTYIPTSGKDRTASFQLINGVSIYGGYAGYGAADPNARNVTLYPTVLSGDIGTFGDNSDNSYHVVTGSYTDPSAVLDGFTITAGNSDATSGEDNGLGGGALILSGNPTIRDCIFVQNNAAAYGGGLALGTYSSPTITGCSFLGNSAYYGGGGMYIGGNSSPLIIDSLFVGNTASYKLIYGVGGTGGAVEADFYCSPTFINCTFTANSAIAGGGAIYGDQSTPIITNCILWNDSAEVSGEIGFLAGIGTVTYSDIENGYSGTGNIAADPQFIDNPTAGADGIWGTSDDDYGDLELKSTSPCVNVGSNLGIPLGITTDLADNARIVGGTVDMGSYEFGSPVHVTSVVLSLSQLAITFSANVGGSISDSTLQLIPAGASSALTAAGVSYNSTTNTATFDLSNLAGGVYSAGISATSVTDNNGNVLVTPLTMNFLLIGNDLEAILPGNEQVYTVQRWVWGNNSSLDLGNNILVIQYAAGTDPINTIASLISTGNANGLWNGNGIISSANFGEPTNATGVGYFDSGSSITIRRSWYGDANLDGTINSDDLSLVLLGQAQGGTRWQDGNFNYDKQVNADDWMELMYAAAYSNGQALPAIMNSSIQTQEVSEVTMNQTKVAGPTFASTPIASDEYLSDLLNSSEAILN